MWYDYRRTTKTNANGIKGRWRLDREDSLDVEFCSEADETQAEALDKLVGRKIWNVELLEDDKQSMIRIFFSENEDDCLLIHCEGADLYLIEPKPKALH
jgi:hypothetical protein